MAITSSAKRAIRVSARKHVINIRRAESMKESMKALKKMADAGDQKGVEAAISGVYKSIDKAAKGGVIKKNTASRKKARIVAYAKKQLAKPVVVKAPKVAKAVKAAKVVKEPKTPKAAK